MKKAVLFCLALVCASLLFSKAFAAEPADYVKKFTVSKAEVWAIADAIREARTDIFDVGQEVYGKYLKSGKAASAVMTYLIKHDKEIILVDTGYGTESSMLKAGLLKAGVKPEDITLVLITHMHGDHIGGLLNGEAAAFANAKVKIGRVEKDFWTDDRSVEMFPSRKTNFELAKKVISVYGGSVEVFEFSDEVAAGIKTVDTSGHTPGHTAYMLESDGKKLMVIGDVINAAFLQFPRPDISSKYDMDPVKAAKTRESVLSDAAKNKYNMAGMHIPFPGCGSVKKDGKQGYKFKPAQ